MVPTIKATPLTSPTRLLRWRASFSAGPGPSSWSGPAAAEPSGQPPLSPSSPPGPFPLQTGPLLPRHWSPSFGNALLFPETHQTHLLTHHTQITKPRKQTRAIMTLGTRPRATMCTLRYSYGNSRCFCHSNRVFRMRSLLWSTHSILIPGQKSRKLI